MVHAESLVFQFRTFPIMCYPPSATSHVHHRWEKINAIGCDFENDGQSSLSLVLAILVNTVGSRPLD